MSADAAFLKRLWPRVKASLEYLIRHDPNGDGLLEGAQHNTLDAAWFGVDALAQLALPRRPRPRARPWPARWATRRSPASAGSWRTRGRRTSSASSGTSRTATSSSGPTRAREGRRLLRRLRDRPGVRPELGVPGRPAGGSSAEATRRRPSSRCGGTTSRPTSARTAKVEQARAAGTRCPARRACSWSPSRKGERAEDRRARLGGFAPSTSTSA